MQKIITVYNGYPQKLVGWGNGMVTRKYVKKFLRRGVCIVISLL